MKIIIIVDFTKELIGAIKKLLNHNKDFNKQGGCKWEQEDAGDSTGKEEVQTN